MRIYIMSNYVDLADEGFKSVAFNLYRQLSRSHEVILVNARKSIFSRNFWVNIRSFQPQIIHIILRPGIFTLIMAKVIRLYCRKAKVVLSALQPPLHYRFIKRFASLLEPDLIVTSSDETKRMFTDIGWRVAFLASGVNTGKFTPVTESTRERLREKYNIDSKKFIVLHVGPIRDNRNLGVLNIIQSTGTVQTIIVANTAFEAHKGVYTSLEEQGCIIWRSYFENIEEIYGLSDCYVFPTRDRAGCVELPLSVLEAMSCNLPVIATRFMALPKLFPEGDGLFFVDDDEDFARRLEDVKNNRMTIKTREKVLPYSWENIAQGLEEIYSGVIEAQ